MKIFNSLCLEISAVCNRTCVFCPNHKHVRPDEYMSMDLINKVLDELAAIKWNGRISPYIYNEPMRDTRIYDVTSLVARKLPRASFMVSTNGDYIRSKEDLMNLYEAGARGVQINIYSQWDLDPDKRVKGIQIAQKRYEQLVDMVKSLPLRWSSDVYGSIPKKERRIFVEPKFGTSGEDIKLGLRFELQNRSGSVDWMIPALKEPLSKMCVRPWRVLNINWKGDALLCCNDYRGVVSFGNINESSLVDIWNNDKFKLFRLFLQNKRRDLPLCATCDYGGGHYTHNVERVSFGEEADKALLDMKGGVALKRVEDYA